MSVQFFFQDTKISLTERKKLKAFIANLFIREETKLVSLNYIFCTDQYLLDINKRFLRHDYFTDIITFNLSDSVKMIEGEVYISADRIRDNAQRHKTTIKEELHRVIFHGALHLCGYTDKSPQHKSRMTGKENEYLSRYF